MYFLLYVVTFFILQNRNKTKISECVCVYAKSVWWKRMVQFFRIKTFMINSKVWNALGTHKTMHRIVTYIRTDTCIFIRHFFSHKRVWNCEFVVSIFILFRVCLRVWCSGLGLFIFGRWLWFLFYFVLLETRERTNAEKDRKKLQRMGYGCFHFPCAK